MQLSLFSWILSKKLSKRPVLEVFKERYLKNLEAFYNWFVYNDKKSVFVPVGTVTDSDKLLYILSCLNAKWDLDFFVRVDASMFKNEIVEQAKTALPSIYLSGTDLNLLKCQVPHLPFSRMAPQQYINH